MPKKGFSTVTFRDEVIEYWKKEFRKNKKELYLKEGITSFSGYVSKLLYKQILVDQKQKH